MMAVQQRRWEIRVYHHKYVGIVWKSKSKREVLCASVLKLIVRSRKSCAIEKMCSFAWFFVCCLKTVYATVPNTKDTHIFVGKEASFLTCTTTQMLIAKANILGTSWILGTFCTAILCDEINMELRQAILVSIHPAGLKCTNIKYTRYLAKLPCRNAYGRAYVNLSPHAS